jgi:hypothetical protein
MNPRRRRVQLVRTTLGVWLPLLVVVGAVIAVSRATDVTPRMLMQDATTVLGGPFYIGSVSLLGVLLWSAATAVCLFGGIALVPDGEWRRLLVWSGLLTALLTFDDAFLFHDEILPIHAGIPGEVFAVVYVVGMLALIVRFRSVIATSNWLLLAVALGLFGVSAVVDVLSSRLSEIVPSAVVTLAEDGPKLLGVGTWLAYFVSAARQAVEADMRSAAG